MEIVSEPLTDILSELDFEETPDPNTCESRHGCSNKATWKEVIHTHCPHDGISAVLCDSCKRHDEEAYSAPCLTALCHWCEALVYEIVWEPL